MSINFEELDYQKGALGELILRRRRYPALGERDVFEVILNDEFLMSSLYTAGEVALAELGLQPLAGRDIDVIVGGLGLGYTAATALGTIAVRSLCVIEALPNVIDWHRRGLVPLGRRIAGDPRCTLYHGDFFALASNGFGSIRGSAPVDAILLDIDHSPSHVLHPDNERFYHVEGLTRLRAGLREAGVFALWSNDPPERAFTDVLEKVFQSYSVEIVDVDNPLTGLTSQNTIYVARA